MSTSVLKALPGKLDIKIHSPSNLYLSVTSHINCIAARCLINLVYLLYQVIMTLHFLNDVVNDAESTQISKSMSQSLVWRVKQWVNWKIEYQVPVFWYQVYQARLWERMLNRSTSLLHVPDKLGLSQGMCLYSGHDDVVLLEWRR